MADEKDTKVQDTGDEKGSGDTSDKSEKDEGGELAHALDGAEKDKRPDDGGEKKPAAGDLKLSVPDELKELVGDTADYVTAAKAAGVSQEQFDKFMAVQFDRVKAAAESADREAERITFEWKRDLLGDPKLGGANLKQTMQVAERGARALGGSALAVAVAKHLNGEEVIPGPLLVRALHMAGLGTNEDRLGERGEGVPKDGDEGLTPTEKEFRRMHPNTWARMQAERKGGGKAA